MSKRIGDRKRKYLVGNMTERQKKIVQLKASINSVSIDDLIVQAIDTFPTKLKEVKCNSCGSEMTLNTNPYEYHTRIDDKDCVIKVENFPFLDCEKCDGQSTDIFTGKYLEELMYFEVIQSIKDTGKPPESIDFRELMKM